MSQSPEISGRFEGSLPNWEAIAACLERFSESWRTYFEQLADETVRSPNGNAIKEPEIGNFIPDLDQELRRLGLVELIKLDLDYRWQIFLVDLSGTLPQTGARRSGKPGSPVVKRWLLEDYLEKYPWLVGSGGPPADLLYEEYHVRRRYGDPISIEELKRRFPAQSDVLERLLVLERPDQSASLLKTKCGPKFDVGDQVDDFDLLTQLGQGAFAKVYLARQRSLQRLVALKISADQGAEPQTLAQLDHPNIVRVYDQRVLGSPQCRLLYMKYVAGGTLQSAIEFVGKLNPNERAGAALVRAVDSALDQQGQTAPIESVNRQLLLSSSWEDAICRIGVQLADALQYAHDKGVLHRDLKPANILLTAEGAPQLVDFNVSFCSKLDGANPTAFFGGSLAYMSPEQLAACDPRSATEPGSLTPASDLFSLGVVLWELFFGSRPYPNQNLKGDWSQTLQSLIDQRRQLSQPVAAQALNNKKSCAIQEVLSKCLAFDPAERIQTGEQLKKELRLCSNPAAKAILRPTGSWTIHFAQTQPLITLIILVVTPNLIATLFNIYFNGHFAIPAVCNGPADIADVQTKFGVVYKFVNAMAYPIGFYVIVWKSLPLLRATKYPDKILELESKDVDRLRRQALRMGPFIAFTCIALWSVAGFIFPAALQIWGVKTWPHGYLAFVGSHVLSGMIAGAYPFLAISWFGLRAMYPRLSQHPGVDPGGDEVELVELSRRTWFWLGCAILLPMFGVLLMVAFGDSYFAWPLAILSFGSLVGSGLFVLGTRKLQHDLGILAAFIKGG